MEQLPEDDLPPQREPVPDGLLGIVLFTVGLTSLLSIIAIWVATQSS